MDRLKGCAITALFFVSGGILDFSAWVNKWIFQFAHVGWGAFLTVALQRHFWWGFLVVAAFAAIKEFVFDPLTETPALSGGKAGDLEDFWFFVGGVVLGLIATYA